MNKPYFAWAIKSSLYTDNWRMVRKVGQRHHGLDELKLGFVSTALTPQKPSIRFIGKARQELKAWQKTITFRDRLVLAHNLRRHR